MTLKEYNPTNCRIVKIPYTKPAAFAIDTTTGAFRFNKRSQEICGIHIGDQVCFLQDETDPANWYIEKVESGGFLLHGHGSTSLIFKSTSLARKVTESVGFKGETGKCLTAGEPTRIDGRTLWGIITGTLVNV